MTRTRIIEDDLKLPPAEAKAQLRKIAEEIDPVASEVSIKITIKEKFTEKKMEEV